MTDWTPPRLEEIDMNAEIGAYQPDFGDERDPPPFIRTEPPHEDAASPASTPA